jgi:hypothetical protein
LIARRDKKVVGGVFVRFRKKKPFNDDCFFWVLGSSVFCAYKIKKLNCLSLIMFCENANKTDTSDKWIL